MIRIGILGAGNIATFMANTVNGMVAKGRDDLQLYAVASRSLEKAAAFAKTYGVEKAYGSYEAMLADPQLDLVYVATPHSHHYAQVKQCLAAGKHVLCEKAFTVNAVQAEELCALAKQKGLLLAEAIWTRYMPSRKMINEVIASGIIGTPAILSADLCYLIAHKERIAKPELAGGALLDIGIYPINFAMMHFGVPDEVESTVEMTELGVDAQETITFKYADGKMAALHASTKGLSDRRGHIGGSEGYLEIENVNNPQILRVYDKTRKLVQELAVPEQITGYEYEVEACLSAIKAGASECPEMPHAETIRVLKLMDALRRDWGLRYPCE